MAHMDVPIEVDDSALKEPWSTWLEQLKLVNARSEVLSVLDGMKESNESAQAFRTAVFNIYRECGSHFVSGVVLPWFERNRDELGEETEYEMGGALEWTAAE